MPKASALALGPAGLLGANSAVGRAIVREAARSARPVVACVRSKRAEGQLPPLPVGSRPARIDYGRVETLVAALRDCESLIHLPGVLVERPGSTYAQANVETTRAAVEAAGRVGIQKLVLVSAVGADPHSPNRYYRTKGLAEGIVASSGIEHTVLRAPLVIGAGTEGEAALLRDVRRPHPRMLGGGRARQQPLDASDLARGALAAARAGVVAGRTLDLVGPESLPHAALVERAGKLRGADVRVGALPIPVPLLRALLRLRERWLGPGFSADALDVILDEHVLDPAPAAHALGIELTPLDDTLRAMLERSAS